RDDPLSPGVAVIGATAQTRESVGRPVDPLARTFENADEDEVEAKPAAQSARNPCRPARRLRVVDTTDDRAHRSSSSSSFAFSQARRSQQAPPSGAAPISA